MPTNPMAPQGDAGGCASARSMVPGVTGRPWDKSSCRPAAEIMVHRDKTIACGSSSSLFQHVHIHGIRGDRKERGEEFNPIPRGI